MSDTAALLKLAEDIRRNPVTFVETVFGFHCWSKQEEILESVRDHARTTVRACHGPGKTALAARATLWWLAAHPGNALVLTTAPTWQQVRGQLWREIRTALTEGQAPEFFADGTATETKFELGPSWYALGLSTDEPARFQGWHNENLLLIVDEASGIDEAIYEAAEGFLSSESSRLLLLGNPNVPSGTFHASFHSRRHLYNQISISAFDTPGFTGEDVPPRVLRRLVSRKYVENANANWNGGTGEPPREPGPDTSPLYDIRVLGAFPSESDDSVISLGALDAARNREVAPGVPAILSADIARFGSDETVIVARRGNHARIVKTYVGRDTMQTVGEILRAARKLAAEAQTQPTLIVDDVGVGGGVVDRLKEISEYRVIPFDGGRSAFSKSDYPNRRSESWFQFGQQLSDIDLDPDEQLAADLLAPTYRVDSSGRRVVEQKADTKKRLRRSPDRADAVLMAFADVTGPDVEVIPYTDYYDRLGGDEWVTTPRGLLVNESRARQRGFSYLDDPSPDY